MQLKIKRSQREGGILSKNAIFCLDARVEFAPEEKHSIARYRLQNQVIYNSEGSKRHLDKAAVQQDGSLGGSLKSLASVAMAAMKLNITISGLERGQHIECKSLDELLGAEEAIMTACQNLKGYLDTAMTFDGREVLVEFSTGAPALVAEATPQPMLAAPAVRSAAVPPPMLAAPSPQPTADDHYRDYASNEAISTSIINTDVISEWFRDLTNRPGRMVALIFGFFLFLVLLSRCAG